MMTQDLISSPAAGVAEPAGRPALVFLLYDSRSGSTMFASLLSRFEELAVTVENFFAMELLESPRRPLMADTLPVFVDDLFRSKIMLDTGLSPEAVLTALRRVGDPTDDRAMIEAFYDLYFEAVDPHGADVRVVKCAPYPHLAELQRTLPDARYLHIVRDGRDVLASKKSSVNVGGRSMERSVLKAALDWRWKVRAARALGDACHLVRYEDLVSETDGTLAHVLDFLGVSDLKREAGTEAFDARIGHRQAHLHTRVGKAVDSTSVARWKTGLRPWESRVYTYVAGAELGSLGYDVEVQPPSALDFARATAEFGWVRLTNLAATVRAGNLRYRLASHRAKRRASRHRGSKQFYD